MFTVVKRACSCRINGGFLCRLICIFVCFGNQISMSVLRIPVSVMKMQVVIIRTVPTAVPVNRDSLEMDQLVMVSD